MHGSYSYHESVKEKLDTQLSGSQLPCASTTFLVSPIGRLGKVAGKVPCKGKMGFKSACVGMLKSPECEGAVAAFNSQPLSSQNKRSKVFLKDTEVGILSTD